MKKISKRILALLLAAVMLLPLGIFSENPFVQEAAAASYPSITLNVPWYSMRHEAGCGISSLAMVEGYVKGYGDNDWTCYSAVYNKNKEIYPKNPVLLYSYSAIGYTTISNSLSAVYEQLKKGNPVVVYRTNANKTLNHFSVIYGYNGSTTSLEKKGFKVKNTIFNSSYSAISWTDAKSKGAETNLETWLKGANWSQTLIRTANKITSLPDKKDYVKVTFNANGGTASSSSGTFVVGEIYGNTMPSAIRDGYTFDGWYTSKSGGTRYTRSSTVTSGNKTLYAHWTKNQTDALEVGHVYRIYNENSGLVIAANGNSDGSNVCQRNKGEKGNGELWRVTEIDSNGYYKFESLNALKTLDVDADDRYLFGARLQVMNKKSHDAQKFSIIRRGDKSGYSGLYSIHSKHSGRAIDVSGSSTKSGEALHQWDYHGGKNQLFYFEEVETRNVTFYDNFNNNYIVSPAEEYEHINSTTPTGHYSSRATDYVKVTLKPDTDSLYIQALKVGSSEKDMKWLATINGSYSRNFAVKNDSTMVLSFRAKSSVSGAKMYFRWGYDKEYQSVTLTTSWADYSVELKRTADSGNNIHPYIDKVCNVEITDISLYEKGTTGYIGDTDAYSFQTVVANVNDDYITPAPLPKNNRNGYTFLGWFTKRVGGTRVAGAAEYFSASLDGDQMLYAHWVKDATYTLTYNANGGSGAPSSQSGATSYTVSSTKPTRSGYTFLGWSTSSTATSASYVSGNTITLSANTTLYAVWKKNAATTYTLTYNANGGTDVLETQTFEEGVKFYISSEIPTRFGYVFDSWEGPDAYYAPGEETVFYENTTLRATWRNYEIVPDDTILFYMGYNVKEFYVKFVPEESANYIFETSYTDDNLDTIGKLYDESGNCLDYSDDYDGNRNFKITYFLEEGQTYYIRVTAFDNAEGSSILKLTQASFTVQYKVDGEFFGIEDETFYPGESVTLSELRPEVFGKNFAGWSESGTNDDVVYYPGEVIYPDGNMELNAIWEECKIIENHFSRYAFNETWPYYWVEHIPDTSGEYVIKTTDTTGVTDITCCVYNENMDCVNYVYSDANGIIKFTCNLNSGESYYILIMPNEDMVESSTYLFTARTRTLFFDANGGTGAPDTCSGDATYYIPDVTPVREGYTFIGWSENQNATEPDEFMNDMINLKVEDTTLYAVWKKNATTTYTLTYNANGGSGAPSSQSGATSYTVSSTKPTRSGYTFLGWSTSSTATSASYVSGNTITLSANTTLYAVWEKVETPSVNPDSVISLSIRKPSITTIKYGDTIKLHADIDGTLPEGAYIEWSANNGNFTVIETDGDVCKITPKSSGDTTFTATVYDKNGNELLSDTQVMTSKAGFFDKLVAFFRGLFGLLKDYEQAIAVNF